MKYKVGDKVRIKSLEWYNENKDKNGYVYGHYPLLPFSPDKAKYCGKEFVVLYADKIDNTYQLGGGDADIIKYWWTDEMIEKIDPQPLFTLTAEEVKLIEPFVDNRYQHYTNIACIYREENDPREPFCREVAEVFLNLLTRIKQWQDGNNV